MGLFDRFKTKKPKPFPPVPSWKPGFAASLDQIVERVQYYTDRACDIAVFRHGTCVVLPHGLSDAEASQYAHKVLADIFHFHPDMNPSPMDDGNLLIQYNHPAFNVVINEHAAAHWDEIARHHLDALATDEVLITPLGPNKFDDFGKKALYGRCFMFMDAQKPEIVRLVRRCDS